MADRRGEILDRHLSGATPANVALMQLLAESPAAVDARDTLAAARAGVSGEGAARLAALSDLLDAHPDAWGTVRSVLAEADHGHDGGDDTPERWAAVFDRLARRSPEAAVALYALGSPELLDAAGREVAAWIRDRGLTGPDRSLLEIGCGYGRLSLLLAGDFAQVTGFDVSEAMIAEARGRSADRPHMRFETTDGRDLAPVPDRSIDLLLAADVFPYLVGCNLAAPHLREAARVLRPGGALLILNYSYRGDPERDRIELGAFAGSAGLRLERESTGDFALWDARVFLLRPSA